MKTNSFFYFLLLSLIIFVKCDNNSENRSKTKRDIIKEVKIGEQIWMSKNLNVDRFQNGDLIPEAKTTEEWENAVKQGKPAWCYFDNDAENGELFGKLYNWYAVSDPRGLAPKGWKVPTFEDWKVLITFLGGGNIAGFKMKSQSGWDESKWSGDGNGSNESGFNGLPGGCRNSFGMFRAIERFGFWWSSTEYLNYKAWSVQLRYDLESAGYDRDEKGTAYSVRCIKI